MLITHLHLFTNENEISLQVTMRDLPVAILNFMEQAGPQIYKGQKEK